MFEGFIRNERTDRYNTMCYIDAHEKYHPSSSDDGSIGGCCSIKIDSTTEALDSLGATIYFIDCCLKALEHNVL